MDHTEALRLQAAEKYILGELTPEVMEEYEQHYFDCFECALDVKAVTAFADASCQLFRQEDASGGATVPVPFFDRVFGWLRPAFAVPVLAGLLLLIGYQNTVTIPKVKQRIGEAAAPAQTQVPIATVASTQAYAISFPLHGVARGERRGEQDDANADRVSVHAAQGFELKFDFLPERSFPHYVGQLRDETGKTILEVPFTDDMTNKEVRIPVAAGLVHAGKYRFVISGDPSASGKFSTDKETERFNFVVENVL